MKRGGVLLVVAALFTLTACGLDGQPDSFSVVDFLVIAGVAFILLIVAWIVLEAIPCALHVLIGCPMTLLSLAVILYIAYLVVWFIGAVFSFWPPRPAPWPFDRLT